MHAQHLVVHQGREVEVVEHVDAVLPRVRVAVLAHALLVKTVHLKIYRIKMRTFSVSYACSNTAYVHRKVEHTEGRLAPE